MSVALVSDFDDSKESQMKFLGTLVGLCGVILAIVMLAIAFTVNPVNTTRLYMTTLFAIVLVLAGILSALLDD